MSLPGGVYNVRYEQDMAIVRTNLQWGWFIVFLISLCLVPFYTSYYITSLIVILAINIIAVQGLNILTGYCGQLSIGHAAFVGVGAYTSAILTTKLGWSFWLALPCAGFTAGIIGLIFGLPSLKVKGLYLAMATLAAQFIIYYVMVHAGGLTGGAEGIVTRAPRLGDIVINSPKSFYYIAIPMCILFTFFAQNLARTRTGRAFVAIRDNDLAAEVMGINLYYHKILAFFIGCFFAGIAGALWAHYTRVATPEAYTIHHSIWYLGMLIVGGMGSTLGAILGTVFIKIIQELIIVYGPIISATFPFIGGQVVSSMGAILFGFIVILFLVYEPRGLAHRWELLKNSYRLMPFSY